MRKLVQAQDPNFPFPSVLLSQDLVCTPLLNFPPGQEHPSSEKATKTNCACKTAHVTWPHQREIGLVSLILTGL